MRALLLVLVTAWAASAASPRPHVYLIVVDGLDPAWATAEHLPHLFAALADEPAHATRFPDARAVMPARTNPNHMSLGTGVFPAAHGITGNAWWSRRTGDPAGPLEDPAAIEVDTLFTRAARAQPPLATVGVFGKPKLGRLFAATDRQRAPDVLWAGTPAADGATVATDAATMDALLAAVADRAPDFAFVNLPGVDGAAHRSGEDDPAVAKAVDGADAAIGRLLDDLHARGRWADAIVFVTADHGFSTMTANVSIAGALAAAGVTEVRLIADGPLEHVYAEGEASLTRFPDAVAARLATVARIARDTPDVAEVTARLPLDGVPSLPDVHPDWHLAHPHAGDLILLARPGAQFVDGDSGAAGLRGNHGGPAERRVPLFVTGGAPQLRAAAFGTPSPSLPDVGATIAALLDLPPARRLDGRPLDRAAVGRPIAALLRAFAR